MLGFGHRLNKTPYWSPISRQINNFVRRVNNDSGEIIDLKCLRNTLKEVDNPSILVTPSSSKAGKIHAIIPSDGSCDLSVDRSTTVNVIGKDGNIVPKSNNVPNISYPYGGESKGCPFILCEDQSTNYYEDTANPVAGTGDYVTAEPSTILGYPATLLTMTNGFSGQASSSATRAEMDKMSFSALSGENICYSFFAKKENFFDSTLSVWLVSLGLDHRLQTNDFNVFTGTGTFSITTGFINVFSGSIPCGDDTYLVYFGGEITLDGDFYRGDLAPATANGKMSIGFPQIEKTRYPTSRIVTNGGIKTRFRDVLLNNNVSSSIDNSKGSVYCHFISQSQTENAGIISIDNGAATNRVQIHMANGSITFLLRDSAASFSLNKTSAISLNSENKVLITWDSSSIRVFFNGALVANNLTSHSLSGMNTYRLGNIFNNSTSYQSQGIKFYDSLYTDKVFTISEGEAKTTI